MASLKSLRNFIARRRELSVDSLSNLLSREVVCPAEVISNRLPLNIVAKEQLPSDRMSFGFSFQDVPGMALSECRVIELANCNIEMLRDDWDSVFVDVTNRKGQRVKFRGSGLPSPLPKALRKNPVASWDSAAMPLEIWSGNYGHWLAYHLPKLMPLIAKGYENHIVLPDRGRWSRVEERDMAFLSLIVPGRSQCLKLRQGITCVRKLAIVDGDPHYESMLRNVASRIVQHACPVQQVKRRRFFISRKNAGYRKLVNERDLVNRLQLYGFESIALEDLQFEMQIELFAGAECVIGMHGSGLANMLFCPRDAKILEVVANDFPCPDFYRLANTLGLHYYLAFGQSIGDQQPGYRDMVAPVDEIEALVKDLF